MALNPSIPLQGKLGDLGAVGKAFFDEKSRQTKLGQRQQIIDLTKERQETQRPIREAQAEGLKIKNMGQRDKNKITSLVTGAIQAKSLVDNGQLEEVEPFLEARIDKLDELGVDSSDTKRELETFRNNPGKFIDSLDQAIEVGARLGIAKDPKTSAAKTPAAIQEFEFFQKLDPSEQKTFLSVKRQNQGFFLDDKGDAQPVKGFADVKGGIKEAEAAGKTRGKEAAEKEFNIPKARASLTSSVDKLDNVLSKIDKALPDISEFTAGFAESLLSKIPGTKATDLKATIDTITANLGFRELQDMRDNSPTGGALGQVSERELELLNAAKQNLENSQTPEQLKENLGDLKAQLGLSKKRIRQAFDADFGRFNNTNENVGTQDQSNVIDFNDL